MAEVQSRSFSDWKFHLETQRSRRPQREAKRKAIASKLTSASSAISAFLELVGAEVVEFAEV